MKWRCEHDWGPWGPAYQGDGGYPRQARECTRCQKIKVRRISFHLHEERAINATVEKTRELFYGLL